MSGRHNVPCLCFVGKSLHLDSRSVRQPFGLIANGGKKSKLSRVCREFIVSAFLSVLSVLSDRSYLHHCRHNLRSARCRPHHRIPSPTLPLSHSYQLLSASLLKNDFDSNVGYGPEAYERIGYIDQPSTSHTAFSRGNGLMHLSISSIIPCEQIWTPPIRARGALSFLLR